MKDLSVLQYKHPRLPNDELGSVPSCLPKDTTAASLRLSLLHHQFIPLCWIIPLAHKPDVISPILNKTRTKLSLHHPGSSASYFSTSHNSKTTFKNCLYLPSPVTPFFFLSPFHEAKSNGQLVFCSSWWLITSSYLKNSLLGFQNTPPISSLPTSLLCSQSLIVSCVSHFSFGVVNP